MFFFFYQKTAYEMRISDWISDVCSSALLGQIAVILPPIGTDRAVGLDHADPHRPVERDVRPQRDIVIAHRIGGVTRFGGVELAGRIVIGLTGRQAVKRAQFVAPPLGTQIGRIGADKIGAAVEAWRITEDTDEIRRQAERRYQAGVGLRHLLIGTAEFGDTVRSDEHPSELQSQMRVSYANIL